MARPTWPPRFLFHSGRLSLDFAHTGGSGRWAKFERWQRPGDLADWLAASPLSLRLRAVRAADLRHARTLRGAIWNGARAVVAGRAVPAAAARVLGQWAARPDLGLALVRGVVAWAPGATAARALATVARDAVRLLGSDDRRRLRQCGNPRCPLLFVDTSRPGRRRWCSMGRCGNLAKTTRYRARQRGPA